MKKRILIISLSIIFLFLFASTLFYLNRPELPNCILVSYSGIFDEVEDNLFVSKDTPDKIRDSIKTTLKSAYTKVFKFWNANEIIDNPIIIFCYSQELFSRYSKPKSILTYKTPIGSYIVFGNDFIDIDMLSHELSHTMLYSQIGYFKDIPVWFDEGLAMQVDYRKDFSEEKYIEIIKSQKSIPDLKQISTPETFWKGNYYLHYLIARHEVDNWLKQKGKPGLNKLITRIKNDNDFMNSYKDP